MDSVISGTRVKKSLLTLCKLVAYNESQKFSKKILYFPNIKVEKTKELKYSSTLRLLNKLD